jgi:hypothetical protein
MGLNATRPLPKPMVAHVRPAELIRLCPGCESPMNDAPPSGSFAVLACRSCGLSVMSPLDRRLVSRGT